MWFPEYNNHCTHKRDKYKRGHFLFLLQNEKCTHKYKLSLTHHLVTLLLFCSCMTLSNLTWEQTWHNRPSKTLKTVLGYDSHSQPYSQCIVYIYKVVWSKKNVADTPTTSLWSWNYKVQIYCKYCVQWGDRRKWSFMQFYNFVFVHASTQIFL